MKPEECIAAWVPPEDWGEAWLLLNQILPVYDPRRGASLKTYFARCWANKRKDAARKRRSRFTLRLDANWYADNKAAPRRDSIADNPDAINAAARLGPDELELMRLISDRGYKAASVSLGRAMGTVKRKVWTIRHARGLKP